MISRKFNTIFIHIPKTGGQSVEMVYLREHGLTWKKRAPLLLRANNDPEKGPRRLAHLFARQYVELGYATEEEFSSFFKFAVVRHPYDRFISYYNYRDEKPGDTPERVLHVLPHRPWPRHFMAPQAEYVTDKDGKLLVDQIVKFENLQEELAPIFERTFGKAAALEHINKSQTKRLTRDGLTPTLREKLHKYYEADFARFSYPP